MKKSFKYFFIFLFFLMFLYSFFLLTDKSEFVFNEYDYEKNEKYDYFYIKSKSNFNSFNLFEYFDDDIKIIGVYPNLDDIYDKEIKKKLNYYAFSLINNNRLNINRFVNNYVSVLKNNNYIDLANNVYFDGVKIDKVLIYTSYGSIKDLVNKYNLSYKVKEF